MLISYLLKGGRLQWIAIVLMFCCSLTSQTQLNTICRQRKPNVKVVEKEVCVQNLTCFIHPGRFELEWEPSIDHDKTTNYLTSIRNQITNKMISLKNSNFTFLVIDGNSTKTTIAPDEEIFRNDKFQAQIIRNLIKGVRFLIRAGCKDLRPSFTTTTITVTGKSQEVTTDVHIFHPSPRNEHTVSTQPRGKTTTLSTISTIDSEEDIKQEDDVTSESSPLIIAIVLGAAVFILVIVGIVLLVLTRRRSRRNKDLRDKESNHSKFADPNEDNITKDNDKEKGTISYVTKGAVRTDMGSKNQRCTENSTATTSNRANNQDQSPSTSGIQNGNINEQVDDTYDKPEELGDRKYPYNCHIDDVDNTYHHLSYSREEGKLGQQEDETYAHAQSTEYDTFQGKTEETDNYSTFS